MSSFGMGNRGAGVDRLMTSANDKPPNGRSPPAPKRKRKSDSAFDLWLQRGLHKMFDDVANEPVPDDLRKLIEDDRGT